MFNRRRSVPAGPPSQDPAGESLGRSMYFEMVDGEHYIHPTHHYLIIWVYKRGRSETHGKPGLKVTTFRQKNWNFPESFVLHPDKYSVDQWHPVTFQPERRVRIQLPFEFQSKGDGRWMGRFL